MLWLSVPHFVGSAAIQALPPQDPRQTAHLIVGKQRLLNLLGVGRGFVSECISLAKTKALGMPHLHKKGFQVLLDKSL